MSLRRCSFERTHMIRLAAICAISCRRGLRWISRSADSHSTASTHTGSNAPDAQRHREGDQRGPAAVGCSRRSGRDVDDDRRGRPLLAEPGGGDGFRKVYAQRPRVADAYRGFSWAAVPGRSISTRLRSLGSTTRTFARSRATGGEDPDTLEPLRRWTRAPQVYIRTVDDTGRAILPEVLQQVVAITSAAVPQYTSGRFGVAGFEQGTETRRGQSGWITIEWTRDAAQFCGFANVGLEGGGITLTYDQPGCSCGSQKIRARTVKHELGHAMGMWHTGQSVDLMSGIGVSECDRNMTARELQYLDYLYRRPVGNTDPDTDPSSAVQLRPVRAFD